MPVLKVKKDGIWEDVVGALNSDQLNGGDADTLDGKHANDFAEASHVAEMQTDIDDLKQKVGDESISEQIEEALTSYATETYVGEKIADLVNSAPEALDTLNELASALGNDPNLSATIATHIGELQSKVGDSSVSDQIEEALSNFSSGKTLTEHLMEEDMILTSRQYGDALPEPGIPGRIFFKRVDV